MAHGRYAIAGGGRTILDLKLNAVGRSLIARRKSLPTRLTLFGAISSTRTLTFRATPPRKKH